MKKERGGNRCCLSERRQKPLCINVVVVVRMRVWIHCGFRFNGVMRRNLLRLNGTNSNKGKERRGEEGDFEVADTCCLGGKDPDFMGCQLVCG